MPERAFVPDDHVVEALPADGADHPFDERILPGRPMGGEDLLGPQASHRVAERLAVGAVPIADEETRGVVPRPRLTELLGGPDGGRVRGDVDVTDPSTIMGQDDGHDEHAEGRGGDGEKVDGSELGDVVGEQRPPGLRRGLPRAAAEVLRHGRLGDLDPQLPQFAVNAGRAPERIGRLPLADQAAEVGSDGRPPGASGS